MTGTMEFRYQSSGETLAVFWHKKTALQVRDDQYPGMKVEQRGLPANRSIRHGVDYCNMFSVVDPNAPAGNFLMGMVATLVEVP